MNSILCRGEARGRLKVDPVVKTVFQSLKCETVIPLLCLPLKVIVPGPKT